MDQQCRAALIFAQAVACQCELAAMQALNSERADKGLAQAYGEDAFLSLSDRYGLGYNALVNFLNNGG